MIQRKDNKFEFVVRIVRGINPPEVHEVGWLDLSVFEKPILKFWIKGEWRPICTDVRSVWGLDPNDGYYDDGWGFLKGETKDRLYTPDEDDDVLNIKFDEETFRYIITSNYQYEEVGKSDYLFEDIIFQCNVTTTDINLGNVSVQGEPVLNNRIVICAIPEDYAEFVQWSDGDTNPIRIIKVKSDINLTAQFRPKIFTVRPNKDPKPDGSYDGIFSDGIMVITFTDGTQIPLNHQVEGGVYVTLTATAGHGYVFDKWADDYGNTFTDNPYTYKVTGNKAWRPVFKRQ